MRPDIEEPPEGQEKRIREDRDAHTSGSQGTVSSVRLRHFSGKLVIPIPIQIPDQ